MQTQTEIGLNRTGIQMSPVDADRMLQVTDQDASVEAGEETELAAMRSDYIADADPVGTVPMPGTVKGAMKTGTQKLVGRDPEVFLDKLGERLAFERTGTRLYDALITKSQAASEGTSGMIVDLATLRRFRDQEAAHFELVAECIETLGGDPTAQTPCADLAGVESLGLMQVLNDPRTSMAQALSAILMGELTDNAGWELLGKLAADMGQDDMARRFDEALETENTHLIQVKRWLEESVRGEAR
jgi:hypothetical protein